MWSSPRRSAAFTLIELAVAMLVVTILLTGLAVPVAAQLQARRMDEAKRQLDDAREALLGFAAAHGRLPCPASTSSQGDESFGSGGDATNGNCSNFYDGFLPAATLGLSPLDSQGFLRDPWAGPANRVRYAVFGGGTAINGVTNALTRANGMQSATLAGLANAPHFIFICSTGSTASHSGCGPATNQLTFRAAFVLLSLGPNAGTTPPAGSDEARNVSGDPVFVYHEAVSGGNAAFDDVIQWVPVHLVVHRLISAGRLP
jgi:type II secretory pathway pseudopilin PulG